MSDDVVGPNFTTEQVDALKRVILYSNHLSHPDRIAVAVAELDCDFECAASWHEPDTNAAGCRDYEHGGYCPWLLAEDLRAISRALYGGGADGQDR